MTHANTLKLQIKNAQYLAEEIESALPMLTEEAQRENKKTLAFVQQRINLLQEELKKAQA